MEKLSSILPRSHRTRVADIATSQPARPGAPLLGRPQGKSSQKVMFEQPEEVVEFSPQARALGSDSAFETQQSAEVKSYNKNGENEKTVIARVVSNGFRDLDIKSNVGDGRDLEESIQE